MPDDDTSRGLAQATEAWLDIVLMATAIALAPCEWGARLVIVWSRTAGDRS